MIQNPAVNFLAAETETTEGARENTREAHVTRRDVWTIDVRGTYVVTSIIGTRRDSRAWDAPMANGEVYEHDARSTKCKVRNMPKQSKVR